MRFLPSRTQSPPPPPSKEATTSGVQVLIPAALNRPTHTLYSIYVTVQPTLQEWSVNRRYSQFLQLRDDMIAALLGCKTGCPSCASFALSLKKFAFPRKAWIRTNHIVRGRVKSLQLFLQLLVQRLYNDLPKCTICGDMVKKMVRPFLIRGAQPMGDSTVDKIQHSLSLVSYALVKHKPRKQKQAQKMVDHDENNHSGNDASYTSTERTGSDPALADPESPSPVVEFTSSTMSDDKYERQYGDERCTDIKVPLEEAMKQVVMLDKRSSTVEEVAFRLSSMWDAYDMDEVMAAAPEFKLSLTQEEYEAEDTGDEGSVVDILGGDDSDEEEKDSENNTSMALLQDEDDQNSVSLTLLQDNDDNNVSLTFHHDEYGYDEADDDEREAEPSPLDEVTL